MIKLNSRDNSLQLVEITIMRFKLQIAFKIKDKTITLLILCKELRLRMNSLMSKSIQDLDLQFKKISIKANIISYNKSKHFLTCPYMRVMKGKLK